MENILLGIPTIIVCSIAYVYAWKFFHRDHYRVAMALLVLCGLIMYLFVSTDFFLHEWDERYHALVAKNLMKHPFIPTLYDNPLLPYDYRNWAGNCIWLHKQPFSLWLMASSMSVFGINEIAVRLPSILMSSIGILLVFNIGNYFFDKRVGFLSAFLFSLNGLIIEMTGGRVATDHVDIAFMFLISLAIFLTIRFVQSKHALYTILIGVSIGAAILTKWLTSLIVLPIWILIVSDSGAFNARAIVFHFALLIITICAVSLPWQLYIAHEFPLEAAWESSYNYKHLTEVVEGRSGPYYYFLERIRINYGELIYLPLTWFLWKTLKFPRDKKRLAVSLWFMVPLLVFSMAKTKMQAYLLFTAPALFMMTAEFFFMLVDYNKDRKSKWLISLLLFLMLALPIRYGIERMKPFKAQDRNPQWVVDLKELNKENIEKGVLFNYENYIEAMFYTDMVVYTHIPEESILLDLIRQGYTVIINDKGKQTDIPHLDGVIYRQFTAPGR